MGLTKLAINLCLKLIGRAVPDPTLDDDNQSDSDEYEYEVIEEIEEVEVETDEVSDDETEINTKSHSKNLTISEGNSRKLLLPKILPKHSTAHHRICSGDNYVTRYQR